MRIELLQRLISNDNLIEKKSVPQKQVDEMMEKLKIPRGNIDLPALNFLAYLILTVL
jgi:hypothetical protein